MASIKILTDKCAGCRLCLTACPYNAIKFEDKKAAIQDSCTLCGACKSSCRFDAIEFEKDKTFGEGCSIGTPELDAYKGVWVFAEQKAGIPVMVTLELLGEGRKLADNLGVKLSAVLLGNSVDETAKTLIYHGADNIYLVDHPSLAIYNDELYSGVFIQLIQKFKPEIVLIGATTYGRSLAPRIASSLNTGLTADCTQLSIDTEKRILLQTRPAFGGNLMATIVCPNHRPQMSTVRPKVMKPLKADTERVGEINTPDVIIPQNVRTKVKEVVNNLKDTVNLAEADIIVAGGLGTGGAANFALIKELAEVLGGAVGASRAAVDAGWIDYSYQIGQTGKTVGPKIYIACGISGAIQHIAGMSSSDTIIAINKDPEAPIFKLASYGITGDINEVLPALIKEFKACRNA